MKRFKALIGGALFASTTIANAGFYASTAHSRGNCVGFNETITWNWSEYHWWEVEGVHIKQGGDGPETHYLKIWMTWTWRAAAYDFYRDPSGPMQNWYFVQGYHFYMASNGSRVYDVYTQASDCGGYNGWWDVTKARGE